MTALKIWYYDSCSRNRIIHTKAHKCAEPMPNIHYQWRPIILTKRSKFLNDPLKQNYLNIMIPLKASRDKGPLAVKWTMLHTMTSLLHDINILIRSVSVEMLCCLYVYVKRCINRQLKWVFRECNNTNARLKHPSAIAPVSQNNKTSTNCQFVFLTDD